jgi:putative addiction module component (TIGR02574 family)
MTDTTKTKQLLNEALGLPDNERAELATRMIDSLDLAGDEDVDAAWADEIERRCMALDSGEATVSDWSDVRDRIEIIVFAR